MALPTPTGAHMVMPDGRHRATLAEIEQLFVTNAPFPNQRQIVFDAFTVWVRLIGDLFPGCRLWIDGGFVTHKPWAAPQDIDVVLFVKQDDLNALDANQQVQFASLLTSGPAGGTRVQPMSGLVDGFFAVRGDPDKPPYWNGHWSAVKGPDGKIVPGQTKGYVEMVV